jgi:uncharacterized delta-60 repeat protein
MAAVALVTAVAGCDYDVGAAPGELDAGFGDGGVAGWSGRARSDDDVLGGARQPDGKVVTLVKQGSDQVLVRTLPDGALDPTFGDGGVARTAMPQVVAPQVLVTGDGDIVVAGAALGAPYVAWLVARFGADGAPDQAYGPAGLARFGEFTEVVPIGGIAAAVPDGDGLLLLAGRGELDGFDDGLVLRLGPDGLIDTTWGPDGTGTVRVGDYTYGGGLARLPDGSVAATFRTATQAGVRRIGADGTPGAVADLSAAPQYPSRVGGLVARADGSLRVVGDTRQSFGTAVVVVGVTPGFALDTAYGEGGTAVLPGDGLSVGLVAEGDAGTIVAGTATAGDTRRPWAARLTPAGDLDPTWGDGGTRAYETTGLGHVETAALGADGAGAVLVGSTQQFGSAEPADIALLALDGAGDVVGDGPATVDLGRAGLDQFTVVEALPGGGLLVAGDTGDGVVAGRLGADGTPDAAHPPAPLLPGAFVGAHRVTDATLGSDGSAYLLVMRGTDPPLETYGGGGSGWRVVKLAPGGGVDTSFGDGGVASRDGWSFPHGVAARPDGTVVVAYTEISSTQPIPPDRFPEVAFELRLTALTAGGEPDTAFAGDGTHVLGQTTDGTPGALLDTPFTGVLATDDSGDGAGAAWYAGARVERVSVDGSVATGVPVGTAAGVANLDADDVAFGPDGSVVVTGTGTPAGATGPRDVVVRLGADLQPDAAFGVGGVATLPSTADATTVAGPHLLVGDDGAVTAVEALVRPGGAGTQVAIRRLLPTGAPDTSYSRDGMSLAALAPGGGEPVTVVEAALLGEDVVVVGSRSGDAVAVRVNG